MTFQYFFEYLKLDYVSVTFDPKIWNFIKEWHRYQSWIEFPG